MADEGINNLGCLCEFFQLHYNVLLIVFSAPFISLSISSCIKALVFFTNGKRTSFAGISAFIRYTGPQPVREKVENAEFPCPGRSA